VLEFWLQVHDEILGCVRDDETLKELVNLNVIQALTQTTRLRVPVGADGGFGANWAEAH